LACGLAQHGIDHVVIDHAPFSAVYSQSTMLDARTLETLDSIGASDPLIRRGVAVEHFALRDRDEKLVAVDFGALPIKYRYALMVPESVAESVLSARAYFSPAMRPTSIVLPADKG
jgi:2-polyprenyl-6-methoxyphenol hydroxylase-like FAD-dependent oxidoreductase